MKGQMKVKKLNDTGLYISEMDWDNTYICKENPIGNFVMVIEPPPPRRRRGPCCQPRACSKA